MYLSSDSSKLVVLHFKRIIFGMRWGEAEGKFDDKWLLKSPEVLVIRVGLAKWSCIVSNLTTENVIVLLSAFLWVLYLCRSCWSNSQKCPVTWDRSLWNVVPKALGKWYPEHLLYLNQQTVLKQRWSFLQFEGKCAEKGFILKKLLGRWLT